MTSDVVAVGEVPRMNDRARLGVCFVIEALASAAGSLMLTGVFFYTEHRFGWGPKENFTLAVAQGVVYVAGALFASVLANALGRRRSLIAIYLVMLVPMAVGLLFQSQWVIISSVLCYTFLCGAAWPALESIVASGANPEVLSRRLGLYNLVWSGVGVVTIAVAGTIIQYWNMGMFFVPLAAHALAVLLLLLSPKLEVVESVPAAHAHPEPELLRSRTQALWLSRIALPSTFVVAYSLMALMPSLPAMQPLETSQKTLVSSTWLAARWVAFFVLGATVWWHTRPRVLLLATVIMLISFLFITIRVSPILGDKAQGVPIDLLFVIAWQVSLGLSMGLIYTASMYFGMVLSEGSTEHNGYHEALIGLGSILGPGAGAITQYLRPGDLNAGIAAVAGVVALSVIAAGIASVVLGKRE